MNKPRREKDNEEGVNPGELGPAQPREQEAPEHPEGEGGNKPADTPDRPSKGSPELPLTGIP